MSDAMRTLSEPRRVGFTLVELLVVIAIIGLLISLVLVAAADGVRRAEERATQSLITKLETALNDRLDALLNTQPPINQTHRFLASINLANGVSVGSNSSNSDDRRAQVIAQFDYLRAEIPDVFFLNAGTSDGNTVSAQYPLNFAAAPYPQGKSVLPDSYVLPLGNNTIGLPTVLNASNQPILVITQPQLPATGMFGASFSAAGGLYKNLYAAATSDLVHDAPSCQVNAVGGYDGVDNNGDGLIDELTPLGSASPEITVTGTPLHPFSTYVANRLAKHTHKTARAEVLYALLVEGLSPLGSSFSREDFTNKEVQDTDGDGLPEFVDAWGEPIQFYRWPVYYGGVSGNGQVVLGTSDSQLGSFAYTSPSETREQDPLDPNQLLVAPGWWSSLANAALPLAATTFSPPNGNTTNHSSFSAIAFMNYFHILVDPNPNATVGTGWDRGSNFTRREYFTKFLILSGGPDREPGVAQLNRDYSDVTGGPSNPNPFPSGTMQQSAWALLFIENQASVSDPVITASTGRTGSFFETPDTGSVTTLYLQKNATMDDITNHNISGPTTGVR
jgi:prepilin-type N-terminal cleavage/methylation domain-containing protein